MCTHTCSSIETVVAERERRHCWPGPDWFSQKQPCPMPSGAAPPPGTAGSSSRAAPCAPHGRLLPPPWLPPALPLALPGQMCSPPACKGAMAQSSYVDLQWVLHPCKATAAESYSAVRICRCCQPNGSSNWSSQACTRVPAAVRQVTTQLQRATQFGLHYNPPAVLHYTTHLQPSDTSK